MANTKQASKRARQSEKHRVDNKWQMTRMSSSLKRVLSAIDSGDLASAQTEYKVAISYVDRLVNKGLVHKNKASRHKSRLNKRIAQLAKAS